MTIDFQKVAGAFEQSPQRIRDLMLSQDLAEKIKDIAITNNLREELFPLFVDEIGYVILSLKSRFAFEKSLIDIGIEQAMAEKISKKTDEVVFKLIDEAPNETNDEGLDKVDIYEKTILSIQKGERVNLPPYIDALSEDVKSSIFNKTWIDRAGEVSKKYGLGVEQAKMLEKNVFFVLASLQQKDRLEESLTTDLGISKIIAEQIRLDVESRIFNQQVKQIETKKPVEQVTPITPNELLLEPPIPVIKQENLMRDTVHRPATPTSAPVPNYSQNKVVINQEEVQSPLPTPRFKAVPMSDIESGQDFIPNIAPKPNAGGIMESKINTVTNQSEVVKTKAPEKYTSDPYREPLN